MKTYNMSGKIKCPHCEHEQTEGVAVDYCPGCGIVETHCCEDCGMLFACELAINGQVVVAK